MATLLEIANHLHLTQARVRELIAGGIITRHPRGSYDLNVVMKEYLTNLREQAAGRSAKAGGLTDERARLAKEQADAKEMENEITRGNLVQIEDVAQIVEAQFDRCRTKLLSLPTKIAPEAHAAPTPAEAREVIENAIVDALNELVGFDTQAAGQTA